MILLTKIVKPLWIGVALCVGMVELTTNDRAILIAEDHIGLTEDNGSNRSAHIDKWNSRLQLPMGSSYCASFVSFVLDSAGAVSPAIRTGVAQKFITRQSITASQVLNGRVVPAGSIVIWKRGDTWMGHVGITTKDWTGISGETIEANTSPSDAGSQSNGDGVYRKQRKISPTAYFRITHFTLVQ